MLTTRLRSQINWRFLAHPFAALELRLSIYSMVGLVTALRSPCAIALWREYLGGLDGIPYPTASLTGTGSIGNYPVKCIAANWMVKFHTGYAVDENDYRDVKALCQQFDLEMPSDYANFAANDCELYS